MVLVDPTHENSRLFMISKGGWFRVREQDDPYLSADLQRLYEARVKRPQSLGNRPLIIVASERGDQNPGFPTELWNDLRQEKRQEKVDLTHLSSRSKLVWDPTSGHNIQVDNPQLVADAIADVAAMTQH